MSARKPVTRSKDKSSLLLALDHVELCSHGVAAYAPFCLFTPGWLIGYDGVVAAGYRVAEDLLGVAPHTETMRHAVGRAGSPYALTVHAGKITVRGDKVRVDVPLAPAESIPNAMPDNPTALIAEPVREALIAAAKVTKARQERVIAAAVYLRANSVVGTDGGTILEAHHGAQLPGEWLLPTEFVAAFERVKALPTHIGWSDDTLTVWFGPHAWLRTNVYTAKYPDTDVIFAGMISECTDLRPVPVDMLQALETLKPFLDDGTITLYGGGFNTLPTGLGASYTFPHHLPHEPRQLPYEAMRLLGMYGEWVAFSQRGFYWYGNTVRGITAAQV